MSPQREEARDRRYAAVHEAGHVVVAQRVGVQVTEAFIYPVPVAGCDYLDQKTWKGDTKVAFFDNPSPQQLAMVGVAGAIAELSWRREPTEKWPSLMSRNDWYICSCQPGQKTDELQKTARAVSPLLERDTGPLWRELCEEADRLIKVAQG